MPPLILLVGGFAALALYLYSQSASASDTGDGSGDNSLVPGSIVGPDGIPVSLPNTRGFRNNNPMNLRYISARPFNGQIANDGGYGVYDTMSNGIRAGGKQLDNYIAGNVSTISAVITKWAPPEENKTAAYIADVAQQMTRDPNDPLIWPSDKIELVSAIIWHENGAQPFSVSDLSAYINS